MGLLEEVLRKRFRILGVQRRADISVLPLCLSGESTLDIVTLSQGLADGSVTITEVGPHGSVPELLVRNGESRPLFILDGEELAGAKQNRVLNTSVLLAAGSETVVPVSCTEQGRWSYSSLHMYDSGNVLNFCSRSGKAESVSSSLRSADGYLANQANIWADVCCLRDLSGASASPTGALHDVYREARLRLDEASLSFPRVVGQQGLLVFKGGVPQGLDVVGSATAYALLHDKLMRSYLMDMLHGERGASWEEQALKEVAARFLRRASCCQVEEYPSVGLGREHRFRDGDIVGSALTHEGKLVHMAFFRKWDRSPRREMSSLSRRRRAHGRKG